MIHFKLIKKVPQVQYKVIKSSGGSKEGGYPGLDPPPPVFFDNLYFPK